MSDYIQDGTGTGYRAKVDSDTHLHTRSVSESGGTDAALVGNLFNINTETIELTSANASALVYMKNTDTVPWVVNRVFYNAGPSTGGTGDFLAEVLANPTTGILISCVSALTPHNLNFGSSNELTGTVLKGAEGSTITNGTVRVSTIIPVAGARVLISFDSIVLPVGSCIAVRITPQTSNTSMDIQVGFNLYSYTVGD